MLYNAIIFYVVSLVILFLVLFKTKEPLYAVVISTLVYGIFTFLNNIPVLIKYTLDGLFSFSSLRIYLLIFLAFYLANLLRELGVLDALTRGISSISPRLAAILVPSAIGLIPMPGGAFVSAITVEKLYFKTLKIKRDYATYLNYWFRHIWVPSWPLSQSIILTAAILGLTIPDVLSTTFIGTVAVLTLIPYIVYRTLPKVELSERDVKSVVEGLWIFILIGLLVIIFRIPLEYVLLVSIALVSILYKPSLNIHKSSFKFAAKWNIFVIIAFSLVFKEYILNSGADIQFKEFITVYHISPYIIAFLLPFLLGISASSEYIFVVVPFPILSRFIIVNGVINHLMLLLAYASGWLAILLSPVHLCLILSAEYYKVKIIETYKYLIPSFIYTFILTILIGYVVFNII